MVERCVSESKNLIVSISSPKKSIACELGYIIGNEGLNAAIEKFTYFKNSDDYYINKYEFNQLAKELFEKYDLVSESKEIYKLALVEYPNSFLLNYSYGKLLFNNNDKESIDYLKKCIYLYTNSPDFKNFESEYQELIKILNED